MKLRGSLFAISLLIAGTTAAHAAGVTYATIGWWSVSYSPTGQLTGCIADSQFKDGTVLEFALIGSSPSEKKWAVFISNPNWNSWIAKKREHILRISSSRNWQGTFSVNDSNGLLFVDKSNDFMNSIADASKLDIMNENGGYLTSLSMRDSAAAIRSVINCVRDHPYVAPEMELTGTGSL